MQLLLPRNQATDLNLLSRDRADYSPWKILLDIAAIPEELPQVIAAERVTATAQAQTSTPTRGIVGSLPTADVPRVPPPQNAPTSTAINVLELETPTVTPRPARPTNPPIISTAVAIQPSSTTGAGQEATATSGTNAATETATRGPNAPTNTSTTTIGTRVAQTPTDTTSPTRSTNQPTDTTGPTRTSTAATSTTSTLTPQGTATSTNQPTTTVASPTPTSTDVQSTSTPSPTRVATATNRATATNTTEPTSTTGSTSTPTTMTSPTSTTGSTSAPTTTTVSTSTHTPTTTNQPTETPTHTLVPTLAPTNTATNTLAPTNTATNTLVPTNTATNTLAPTETATNTLAPTETATNTLVPTETATNTLVPTEAATATATETPVTPVAGASISQSVNPDTGTINLTNFDFTITVRNTGSTAIQLTFLRAVFDSQNPPNAVFGIQGCTPPSGTCDQLDAITIEWLGDDVTIAPGDSFPISVNGSYTQIGGPPLAQPITICYANVTAQITEIGSINGTTDACVTLTP